MTTVLSRIDAQRLRAQRFFTGEPCANGHLAERYTASNRCVECDRDYQARYKAGLPPKPPKVKAPAPPPPIKSRGLGFAEPDAWPYDDCKRREPVLDMDSHPPRVVRSVGWRCCMKCETPYFSADVTRLRLCDRCRGQAHENSLA